MNRHTPSANKQQDHHQTTTQSLIFLSNGFIAFYCDNRHSADVKKHCCQKKTHFKIDAKNAYLFRQFWCNHTSLCAKTLKARKSEMWKKGLSEFSFILVYVLLLPSLCNKLQKKPSQKYFILWISLRQMLHEASMLAKGLKGADIYSQQHAAKISKYLHLVF